MWKIPFFSKGETDAQRQDRVALQKDIFEFHSLIYDSVRDTQEGKYDNFKEVSSGKSQRAKRN